VTNRKETWNIALCSKSNLEKEDSIEMRDQIILTAEGYKSWDIWLSIFCNDEDMLSRLLEVKKNSN